MLRSAAIEKRAEILREVPNPPLLGRGHGYAWRDEGCGRSECIVGWSTLCGCQWWMLVNAGCFYDLGCCYFVVGKSP